jgi:DNA (cytosine-5)-methyltransferase 1
MQLVLSLFSGAGLLDHAFAAEGFCCVSAGDVIGGSLYDLRQFHPPANRFDGVIGGDPCQSHSSLANLVRAKGLEPSFPDMTGEYQRVIEEARPAWFLRENVPKAPDIKPLGYDVRTFLLDNWASLGEEQSRRRRFWFGVRDGRAPELRAHIPFALSLPVEPHPGINGGGQSVYFNGEGGPARVRVQALASDARAVPVALGGSGKVKATATDGRRGHREGRVKQRAVGRANNLSLDSDPRRVKRATVQGGHDATPGNRWTEDAHRRAPVTARHEGHVGAPDRDYSTRYTLEEMLALQGLPADFFKWSPFTVQGKRRLIGNGVAMPTGRAIATAVRRALECSPNR